MKTTLLEQFFLEECTPHIRDLLEAALAAAKAGSGPMRKRFELNRFEVTLDVVGEIVILEDILDVNQAGELRLPLSEFFLALERLERFER